MEVFPHWWSSEIWNAGKCNKKLLDQGHFYIIFFSHFEIWSSEIWNAGKCDKKLLNQRHFHMIFFSHFEVFPHWWSSEIWNAGKCNEKLLYQGHFDINLKIFALEFDSNRFFFIQRYLRHREEEKCVNLSNKETLPEGCPSRKTFFMSLIKVLKFAYVWFMSFGQDVK